MASFESLPGDEDMRHPPTTLSSRNNPSFRCHETQPELETAHTEGMEVQYVPRLPKKETQQRKIEPRKAGQRLRHARGLPGKASKKIEDAPDLWISLQGLSLNDSKKSSKKFRFKPIRATRGDRGRRIQEE